MIHKILKNPQAVIGLVLISVVLITAMFAPLLAPNDPEAVDVMLKFGKASEEFPMGNDALGRCVLSRLLYGARYSKVFCPIHNHVDNIYIYENIKKINRKKIFNTFILDILTYLPHR